MTAFNSRELRFLRVVASESGRHYWHGIETRLAGVEPYKPSALELGRRLEAIGITRLAAVDEIAPRYCITDRGRAALDEIERNGWILGPAEAAEYAAQLAGPIEMRLAALAQFLEEPALFEKVILQLRAAGLSLDMVAWSVQLVVRENRSGVAFTFATDPSPEVRTALFLAWGGPGEGSGDERERFKPPGAPFDWATDSMFVDLLTLGLNDPAPSVRDAAARLAYLTQSGVHVVDELLADLASPAPSKWSAAALGTARCERSLATLRAVFATADDDLAGCAARGFAARPDARADLFAALRDKRRYVRWSAEVALGMIARGLTDDELAALDRYATYELRTALAHYRANNHDR
jgi:hypothetical protein